MADDIPPPEQAAALDAWVLENWSSAVAYATSFLRDRASAEDVVHDCFYNLLRNAGRYDLPRDGTRLLFRSVTNECFKRNSRGKATVSLSLFEDDGAGIADTSVPEPSLVAMTEELREAIAKALARLPLPQQAALKLKSMGHSLHEIAQILEVSVPNAGVLVHRARRALADQLSDHVGGNAI